MRSENLCWLGGSDLPPLDPKGEAISRIEPTANQGDQQLREQKHRGQRPRKERRSSGNVQLQQIAGTLVDLERKKPALMM